MKYPRFSVIRSVDLPCTIQELYDFHQNPENMRAILMPGQKLVSVEGDPVAREGAEFTLHLRMMGVPLRWKARWAVVDEPLRLVDESLEGPFPFFLHEHRFRPLADGGSRMTDHIMYALPIPWLSWPLSLTVAYAYLQRMLQRRHERTLAYFKQRVTL